MRYHRFVFAGALTLSLTLVVLGKSWCGITPLKSTKAEIQRIWGEPDRSEGDYLTYFLPEGAIYFQFSGNPGCTRKVSFDTWNVAPDTVTTIKQSFRDGKLLKEFESELSKFERVDFNSDDIGHSLYVNKREGFSIEVQNDFVISQIYAPEGNQEDLRCRPTTSKQP